MKIQWIGERKKRAMLKKDPGYLKILIYLKK